MMPREEDLLSELMEHGEFGSWPVLVAPLGSEASAPLEVAWHHEILAVPVPHGIVSEF